MSSQISVTLFHSCTNNIPIGSPLSSILDVSTYAILFVACDFASPMSCMSRAVILVLWVFGNVWSCIVVRRVDAWCASVVGVRVGRMSIFFRA